MKLFHFISLAVLAMTTLSVCNASEESQKLIAASEGRVYQSADGHKLPYRLFKPDNYDPNKSYPLIIYLHGAGERGNDNMKQVVYPEMLVFISGENRTKNPAFLIAPQCENGKRWCETDWTAINSHDTPAKPSDGMKCLFEVVDGLEKEFSIDKSRLYVTGMSMGGFGTCDFVCRRGNEVAAYICLCGGADNKTICKFKNAKGWFFHGDKDNAVHVERSRSAVEALKAAGCDVKYTELPGRGHKIWVEVYTSPGLSDWLFEQKLSK